MSVKVNVDPEVKAAARDLLQTFRLLVKSIVFFSVVPAIVFWVSWNHGVTGIWEAAPRINVLEALLIITAARQLQRLRRLPKWAEATAYGK